MKGKELEKLCIYRMEHEEARGRATMSRYGVQASMVDEKWIPIQSLPDFEGIELGGHQFVMECKVCSAASFPLDSDKFKDRQLRHMLKRSAFGAVSFLLLHFKERELKTKSEPARTIAFPVDPEHPFWLQFSRGEVKRITKLDAEQYGEAVHWTVLPRCRKESPDILDAIDRIRSRGGDRDRTVYVETIG